MPVNVKLRKEIWAFKTSLGYRVVDYLWKIERKTDRQTDQEGRKEEGGNPFHIQKFSKRINVLAHICHPSTRDREAREFP